MGGDDASDEAPPAFRPADYGDEARDMTIGRRVARYLSSRYSWYYPALADARASESESESESGVSSRSAAPLASRSRGATARAPPTTEAMAEALPPPGSGAPPRLDAAWAYFEHVTLPRHFAHRHHGDGGGHEGAARSSDPGVEAGTGVGGGDDHGGGTAGPRPGGLCRLFDSRGVGSGVGSGWNRAADVLERAKPGESAERTRLYPVLRTPEAQLADFGVGVGLYFNSLRALGIVALVAGLLNLPVLLHFSSPGAYSARGQLGRVGKPLFVGSAVCPDAVWRACPACQRDDWAAFPPAFDRYAVAVAVAVAAGRDDQQPPPATLRFILQNGCRVDDSAGKNSTSDNARWNNHRHPVGLFSFLALIWTCVATLLMGRYSRCKEVQYDEAQQTTTDYSVEVENPPTDACDPDEWKAYFEGLFRTESGTKTGHDADADAENDPHVTVCTVALDNEDLVKVLAKRKRLVRSFELGLPPGVTLASSSDLEHHLNAGYMPPKPWWRKLLCLGGRYDDICTQIRRLDEQIDEMSQRTYDVSNIFVTFETEADQRRVLDALSVRKWDVWTNHTTLIPTDRLFRKKHVLSVREPPEPSAVRWQDLDETFWYQVIVQVITTIISLVFIAVGGVLIALARRRNAASAAIVITIMNTIAPPAVKFITSFESHSSEGSNQTSQYIKMTALRWCNTAIVTTIITPFTDTVRDGNGFLINGVYAIFIAELVKTPLLQLTDVMGNINRHLLAPRAPDQRRMNLKFTGGSWELSERYTDLTKVLFLCFFYSAVFPAGFLFTACILFVHYWTDKFCLLRSWAPAPRVGTEISKFSRSYFFPLALLVYAVMLSYGYASFPYDNVCDKGTPVSQSYVGTHNATSTDAVTGEPIEIQITIPPDGTDHAFCYQDMIRFDPIAFPPLPRYQPDGGEWMTSGQGFWSAVHGWTAVAMLGLVCSVFLYRTVVKTILKVLYKPYKEPSRPTHHRFSDVEEIYGYVPKVNIAGEPFPKLLCYIDSIDRGLVGWADPYRSYDVHNLIFDVPKVANAVEERRRKKQESSRRGGGEEIDSRRLNEDDDRIVTDTLLFSIVKHWPPDSGMEQAIT